MSSKKVIFLVTAAGLIGAAGYGLYQLGMNRGMKMVVPTTTQSGETGTPPADNSDKKVLFWHDPMVPGPKFDKPGKSPFMDMQLVPVYAGDESDEGTVNISARVQQNLGIRTATVMKGNLAPAIVAVGSVAYNERNVALVQARSNGFVERLYVRAPLDGVRKGQPLAELYVPEWVAAQEEYLTVRRLPGIGTDDLIDGARQRMRLVGMTNDQIRPVEESGKVWPRLTIVAPISGVVAELAVREGMTVMNGAPLFRIYGLDSVWVNADVPENISAQVRPGNAVQARVPAWPGTVFKGKVGAILPEVDPMTRTLKARIELANPAGRLVPGMFATINVTSAAREDALWVPTEAVIQTGTRTVVIAVTEVDKFAPIEVEIGTEVDDRTEIQKGLESGQKVVVSGQFLIDSEASLKGAVTRMSATLAPRDSEAKASLHRGEGTVEDVGKNDVTISHGPIHTLQWGPMTMDFKLPADGLPKNIAVGKPIVFEFRPLKNGFFEITTIMPSNVAPAPMNDTTSDGAMQPLPRQTETAK